MWLCGLLVSGELFLWNRDKDLLKTAAAVPEILQLVAALQGRHIKKIATTHMATFNFDLLYLSFARERNTTVTPGFRRWLACACGSRDWASLLVGVHERSGFGRGTRWRN